MNTSFFQAQQLYLFQLLAMFLHCRVTLEKSYLPKFETSRQPRNSKTYEVINLASYFITSLSYNMFPLGYRDFYRIL